MNRILLNTTYGAGEVINIGDVIFSDFQKLYKDLYRSNIEMQI
jgi:hypothetical protein